MTADALARPSLAPEPEPRAGWRVRVRAVTERLRGGGDRRMSTGSLIGFASVAVAILGLAGGLLANYGAWQRIDGAREATDKIMVLEVAALRVDNKAQAIEIAVLKKQVEVAEKAMESATKELRMKEENDHEREVRDIERGVQRRNGGRP